MQVTIDNQSGAGPIDYTASIESSRSVLIKRQLNAPSECSFSFLPDAQSLPLPLRYARVSVSDTNGALLFTGYVATAPAMVLRGVGVAGPSYEAEVTAISDELLLDSILTVKPGTALNQPMSQALQTLTHLTGTSSVTLAPQSSTALVGRYQAKVGTNWSRGAGLLASSARSAYRVVDGVTSITPVGTVTHTLSESDGSLQLSALKASTVKLLASDVTVCGKIEPAAYVTETFQGDGVTLGFSLTSLPFEPVSTEKLNFTDLFQGASLNGQVWQWTDSSARLSITANGVSCAGGSGRDGETVLSAIDEIELGGSIVLEAGGVQVTVGSQGLILGLYEGTVSLSNCLAAFDVSQAAGVTQLAALVNGVGGGSSLQLLAGHVYTLRIRVYAPEMERVQQSYYYLNESGMGSYGGDAIVSPGHLVMEVQDATSGAPGAPVVLYDGRLAVLPPACTIGLLDSGNLTCSVKTFTCSQGAPIWVTSTPTGGTPASQYIGTAVEGGSCTVSSAGKLTFHTANLQPAGALINVSYRTRHRAVARRSISWDSVQPGSASTAPATTMWVGSVSEPAAWSSADCDNAAAALLESSSVESAAWAGTYTAWNLDKIGDVWPGDVLSITSASAGISAVVVVRNVEIQMGCANPQMVKYTIRFANDWAEELALKLSATVPEDAWLPATPSSAGAFLNNLVTLVATSITGSQIQVDAGVAPPAGGGFEVKRKDWTFGPGVDSDLVLRSPVRYFTIPRLAAMEQYYVRMYDGSTPPNYSQFSAALYVNVPLSGS